MVHVQKNVLLVLRRRWGFCRSHSGCRDWSFQSSCLPVYSFFPQSRSPDLDEVSDPLCPSLSPEPTAVFAKEQPAHREVQVVAGSSGTLSCEVAQAQTQVTWYKDGKKLSGSSKVHVEATGCTRRLVLQQAGKADGGAYSCEVVGGQSVSFHLDVTGQFFGGTNLALCVGNDYSPTHPGALSTGPRVFEPSVLHSPFHTRGWARGGWVGGA